VELESEGFAVFICLWRRGLGFRILWLMSSEWVCCAFFGVGRIGMDR